MSASVTILPAEVLRSIWLVGRKWITRGLFAIIDQGLISGSNFALGVLLARWLGPAEYGVYALAFATFLLLSLVHHALLLEPMSVFGGSAYRSGLPRYLGLLLWIQVLIGSISFSVLAGAAFVVRAVGVGSQLAPALLGMAFAAPAVLVLWFARRALYLEYLSRFSAFGALIYAGVLFAALRILYRSWKLSALSAFVVMGTSALIASTFLLVRIRPKLPHMQFRTELTEVSRQHWRYGRWALASTFFIWVPWNLYYSVVSSFFGLSAAGELRALLNLALPMAQTYAALALLMLPRAAGVAQREGWPGMKREALNIACAFTAIAILYWAAVIIWRVELVGFLYSGNYGNIAHLVPWLAIASIASGTIFGPLCAFRAMQSPATVCWVYLSSSIVGIVVGVPATRAYGLSGTVLGIVLSSVLSLVFATIWLARRRSETRLAMSITLADSAP
jgi:O-antigen/teichoic acid export membrane protein